MYLNMTKEIIEQVSSGYGKTIFGVIALNHFGLLFDEVNFFDLSLMILGIMFLFVGLFTALDKKRT